MTMWTPGLRGRKGPIYKDIAEALAADIRTGKLPAGSRLPTHRDLANRLKVTVGTVSRAYAEAFRLGLIRGEVGRGTFVREAAAGSAAGEPAAGETGLIDLSLNLPMNEQEERELAAVLAALARRRDLAGLLAYKGHAGLARHRAAGAAWAGRAGLEASPDEVIVTNGVQHAMAVVMAALARPGEVVLVEELTYPGMKTLADLLHLELRGVAMDSQGIDPEALDRACAETGARLLYAIPTIQNPTTAMMPEERRREIARVARAHDMLIVEDDIYGLLPGDRPPPLAAVAPERVFYLTGLSKTVAPGLRIGFLVAPKQHFERLLQAMRSTTWMATPLAAEIAAIWIEDGSAAAILARRREEIAGRQKLAAVALADFEVLAHPFSYHLWLKLPQPFGSGELVARAMQRGLVLVGSDAFTAGGEEVPAIRVCLGGPPTRARLEQGLAILKETIAHAPRSTLSVV